MASEEKTSAADIPLKSDEDEELVPWTMASREKTSAASIPLKSHEEVVPWTMAREEIQEGCAADFPVQIRGCSADFPVKSNREGENQIVGCAADFPVPIDAADLFDPIVGCAADFPVKRDREPTMDRSHAYPQGFNESPPSTCFCTCFSSPTVRTARKENQIDGFSVECCAEDFPVQIDGCAADIPVQSDREIIYRSHEVSLDINEIATSLRDQLKTNKAFSSTCCIYRVPESLRESNEKAYAPRVVSIGPIHHGKENLKAMEDHKITYLRQFLEQSEVSVEDLINIVRDNDTELRDCYAETIDLSRNDFATMILLDAVFIITVLLYSYDKSGTRENGSGDHKFFRPRELFDVMWDMCLLENQLPFFILKEFFKRYSNANASLKNRTVIELTSRWLQRIMPEWVKEDSWKTINSSEVLHFVDLIRKCQQPTERSSEERKTTISIAPSATKLLQSGVLHFVDFIRKCQKPTKQSCEETEIAILSAPTATALHQSGVKFKKSGSKSLLDIRFSDGILEIPQLIIHARTETLFRNLQAFEQCHYLHGKEAIFISDYITFIGCLVLAPNDVKVLADNENLKILFYSNEAVSNLLHNLDKENAFTLNSIFSGVFNDLNSHCRKRRHRWKANLKQDYFKNPWTAISVAAAAFLLILTVIQTVCSILQL